MCISVRSTSNATTIVEQNFQNAENSMTLIAHNHHFCLPTYNIASSHYIRSHRECGCGTLSLQANDRKKEEYIVK